MRHFYFLLLIFCTVIEVMSKIEIMLIIQSQHKYQVVNIHLCFYKNRNTSFGIKKLTLSIIITNELFLIEYIPLNSEIIGFC